MTHRLDLCACGHARSDHKINGGACKHNRRLSGNVGEIHEAPCEAFELVHSFVPVEGKALTLLQDLVETNEPYGQCDRASIDLLIERGFAEPDGRGWVGITKAGRVHVDEVGPFIRTRTSNKGRLAGEAGTKEPKIS